MSIYNRISEVFDIKDLLQTKNPLKKRLGITKVELDKGKGSGSIQIHITEESRGRQRILLFDQDQDGKSFGHFRYNNRTYQNDSGDIVQFIANRIEGRRLNDAIKLLNTYDYRSNADKWKKEIDFEVVKNNSKKGNTTPLEIEKFQNLRGLDELILKEEPHYLEKRHISNDTVLNPKFLDRIMVYENKVETSKGPVTFNNIFFPKFDDNDKVVGAEIKTGAKTNNNLCLGLDHLMWCSNKPEIVEKVALFESALDALSHFQLSPSDNTNTWYFSTNGNFYDSRQTWFYEKLEKEELDPKTYSLVLATDRDYDGLVYDLAAYNKTLSDNLPDKGQEPQEFFTIGNVDGKPSIQFHSHYTDLIKDVNVWFFSLQDHFNNQYVNDKDNYHINIKASNDRVSLIFPSKTKLQDASKRLSASLLRNVSILNKSNIKVHKASFMGKPSKDWNAALALSASRSQKNKGNTLQNKKSFI